MTDCSKHRVVAVPGGDHFELRAEDGRVLLTTENVSVETLVGLVAADKEGRMYEPDRKKGS